MPVLKGRRANGHPISITLPTGTPPTQVGSLTAGTPTSTTIPVTYTAATGTATIGYSGQTSTDGGATYAASGGTFTSTGGTFTGLSPATAYRLRIIATNGFLPDSATALAGAVTTASPAATTYTAAISPSSGLSGSSFTYTVTPGAGGWPSGTNIIPTVSGGAISPLSGTGSGTTPIVFTTVTATGAAGTNCVVNSSAAGMTNLTGALTYTITNPTTLGANRYDILVSGSSGDTATARTVSAVPNGVWSGDGSKAITLTATKAGGGTSSVGSITLPSSGSATQTVLWTPPSAGEWTITGTNTASMHNPLGAYYTVFAASPGTAQTISANSSYFLDQQPFQQDNWSGTPTGFSAAGGATLGMGWGIFQIQATTGGASAALYGQLYDSDSSGATTSAGTGTAVTNAAQIYGAVGGGTITVNVNLPSSDVTYYLDIATNNAMTNRARIPLRFRITDVVAILSRSMEVGWMQTYPYPGPPGNTGWSSYTKTMFCGCQNPGGSAMSVWGRADGVHSTDFFASWGSVGAQEAGRRFFNKKGHGCALVGVAEAGGNTDDFLQLDGTPYGGFSDAVSRCNYKFRYIKTLLNGWAGYNATPESESEYLTIYSNFVSKMTATYPALAVMAIGTASGQFGHDGSNTKTSSTGVGYTRTGKIITDQIEPTNPMVSSADAAPDWDEWTSGHATWASQTRYVRNGVLAMLMADGAHAGGYGLARADRYATFATTGTVSGNDIRVPFTLPAGATSLIAKKWQNGTTAAGWTYSTPTTVELRDLVAVFPPGLNNATGRPIWLDAVSIDNTNKWLVLTLSRSGGAGTVINFDGLVTAQPASFNVQLISDFNDFTQDYSRGIGIFDDRTLDDYGYGPHVRPQLDVVCS